MQTRARRQRGLSLVELMIALTIGLVIVAAGSAIYATSKRSYNQNAGLARVQENTRGALLLMDGVIRNAGYLPDPIFQTNPAKFFVKSAGTLAVYGGTGAPGTALPIVFPSSPVPVEASDWIAVSYVGCGVHTPAESTVTDCPSSRGGGSATGNAGSAATNNYVSGVISLRSCQGDPVPIGSKQTPSSTRTITNSDLKFNTQLVVNVFYVAKASGAPPELLPSLYCMTQYYDASVSPPALLGTSPPIEPVALLQGVNLMKITYGVDYQGNRQTDQRLTSAQIENGFNGASWPLVSSVQITLSTQNAENVVVRDESNANSADTSGKAFGTVSTDGGNSGAFQIRQTQSIAIRNRLQ